MTIPYQNYNSRTRAPTSATRSPTIDEAIKKPGDGSTSSTPQKYLFFVSDGVADRVNGSPVARSR